MDSPPRRLSVLFACLGLGLLAAFTLVDDGTSYAQQWPWHLYAQLLWLLPWFWLGAGLLTTPRLARLGGGLDWGLLGFAAANIAAALCSPWRATAIAVLPTVLAPVAMSYALATWLASDERRVSKRCDRVARALSWASALVSLAALGWWGLREVLPRLTAATPWNQILLGRNLHPLGHPNYTAGAAILGVAWLAGHARASVGPRRLWCAAGALLALGALFTSGSRSGFLALGVWLLWQLREEARARGWTRRRLLLIGLVLLAGGTTLAVVHPRTRYMLGNLTETRTLHMADRQRLAMMEFAVRAVQDRPLLGTGPGATPRAYPLYRPRLSGGLENVLQLHSTPIQWAADTGLLGLLAAALAGWGLLRLERATRSDPSLARFAPHRAALGTLLAYAVFALSDYQLDVPFFAFFIGALLALSAHTPPTLPHAVAGRTGARWGAAISLALATGLVATQVTPLRARAAFAAALSQLDEGNTVGFRDRGAAAAALQPGVPHYLNRHALLLAGARAYADWYPGLDFGPDAARQATEELRRSLTIAPEQEIAHSNLAWLLRRTDPAQAARHFRSAVELVPDKSYAYLGLAAALLAQGREQDALAAAALEIVNNPVASVSPAWQVYGFSSTQLVAARLKAANILRRVAAEIGPSDPLQAGRRARYAASILDWLGGDDHALTTAESLAEPIQRPLLGWLSGKPIGPGDAVDAPWAVLARAAATPAEAAPVLRSSYGRRAIGDDLVEAMIQRLRLPDRRQLFLLGERPPAPLLLSHRRERTGYLLLIRNLDGPPPRDLPLLVDNRLVSDFLWPLFPERGFLPTPVLQHELARLPR